MPVFQMNSDLSYFFEMLHGSSETPLALNGITLDLIDGFDLISVLSPSMSVTSLASDRVVLEDVSTGHSLTLTGSGIDPVSSLADLQTAIDNGLASGAFSKLVLRGPLVSGGAAADLLTLDMTATGYTLSSGSQTLAFTGGMPVAISEFMTLAALVPQIETFGSLNGAQRAQLITDLAGYGVNGVSLIDGADTLLSFAVTSTSVTLSLEGYTLALQGTFPTDFADLFDVIGQITDISNVFGYVSSLASISGLALTGMTVTGPQGQSLFTMTGEITDQASLDGSTLFLDGVAVSNMILGSDDPFSWPSYSDYLTGTPGDDQIFGLGGNDNIFGDAGNDMLFGGSGNDNLQGGAGDDLINPGGGSFEAWDSIETGTGNDTVDMSDVDQSGVGIYHWTATGGITATVNGATNTGLIDKGTGGTTTLVDAVNAMDYWGLGIGGTGFDDVFNVTLGTDQWIGLEGQGGTNTYNILGGTGIVRLDYFGATSGLVADLSLGTVTQNSYGGNDVITGIGSGPVVEIQATNLNDRITGSDFDDRFILRAGSDTLDGGAGTDLVRYDRSGVLAVNVNLATGIAQGNWGGQTFTHYLSNIEDVRGSRADDDYLTGNNGKNTLDGRGGDDFLFGGAGNDTLIGGAGSDAMSGGQGVDVAVIDANFADALVGIDNIAQALSISIGGDTDFIAWDVEKIRFLDGTRQTADVLASYAPVLAPGTQTTGADLILGTSGGERLQGDGGNDTLIGLDGKDSLFGGNGNDALNGGRDADRIYAGAGQDSVTGSNGSDYVNLGGGNDFFEEDGEAGTSDLDTILGGAGNDTVHVGGGNNLAKGEAGNDFLYGGIGDSTLSGGDGQDTLYGGVGNEVIQGGKGQDIARLGDGNDVFIDHKQAGVSGRDTVYAGAGDDTIRGKGGDDHFFGDDGDDAINGGSGNDEVWGGNGADTINAGRGVDFVQAGFGRDLVMLGAGDDYFTDMYEAGLDGRDTVYGGDGKDSIIGFDGNDVLVGGTGGDTIFGGDGWDTLKGSGGYDWLDGEAGKDKLEGGTGNDTLLGGGGNDLFVFTDGFGKDNIHDFDKSNGEKISLAGVTEITDFADLLANHLVNAGGFAKIVDGTDSILLQDVLFTDVGVGLDYSADDFLF